jgi:large subunit ribosomal protein L32
MGAICPKGKLSKGRRDRRRAQSWTIVSATLTVCPKCGELTRAHRACRSCGTYDRKTVYAV